MARLVDLGLEVRGLMTVAAPGAGAAKPAFETLARLADRLGLEERSMGMSDDLEAGRGGRVDDGTHRTSPLRSPTSGDGTVRRTVTVSKLRREAM